MYKRQVFFIVIASAAGVGGGHTEPSLTGALVVFVQEALGGIAFGALIGWITYRLCRSIEAASVEILLTLASVVGGYVLAASLGLSGPLAMVVAGLVMSAGKERAFGEHTRERIEGFWETLDEVLNLSLIHILRNTRRC